MSQLRILLDRPFPYDPLSLKQALKCLFREKDSAFPTKNEKSALAENFPVATKPVPFLKKLPDAACRLIHALEIYYRSFSAGVVQGFNLQRI